MLEVFLTLTGLILHLSAELNLGFESRSSPSQMFADSLDTFLRNMSMIFMFNEFKTCLNLEFKNFCSQALDMDGWVVTVLSLV